MIFLVLAGLRELLRRAEATLPRGRRLLLESLDSALALAERTATTLALSPVSPPLAALPQDDQEQGRSADGVIEANRSQSVIARLFFFLPQVMVIFTTMMVVVIGLLVSVPGYPLQAFWRTITFNSTGRIIVPTPLRIALWLRNRRLFLRAQALEDAPQTPAEGQVLELADVGVDPPESTYEDITSVRSELVQSGSQDASGSQDVLGAVHLSHSPLLLSDSSLPAISDSASEKADSHASLQFSDSALAHRAPTPAAQHSFQTTSDSSSSVYITSAASVCYSPSPSPSSKSSDSEAHSAPAALSLVNGPSPPRPALQPPSSAAAPRSSPQMPSRIPVPISRGRSPAIAERGAQMVEPVFYGRGQTSHGPPQSPKREPDSPGSGVTALERNSPLYRARVSSDQEFVGQDSESTLSSDRDESSDGLIPTFSGRGQTSTGRNDPLPAKSPMKQRSPLKRRSPKSPGRMRTSLGRFSRSPGKASLSQRCSTPPVAARSEPPSRVDPSPERETGSPTPGTSDTAIGSQSSIPHGHVGALSVTRLQSISETPLVLVEGPSSTDKSRSTSPELSEMTPATQSLHYHSSRWSEISPEKSLVVEASSKNRLHATPESSLPAQESHSAVSGRLATLESTSPPPEHRSPNPGPHASRGSQSPDRQPPSPTSGRLVTPDSSPANEPRSPNPGPGASRRSKSPARQSHSPASGRLTPPGSTSLSPDTQSRQLTSPRPRSPVCGPQSPSRTLQISPRESLSTSRQSYVYPRGQISPNRVRLSPVCELPTSQSSSSESPTALSPRVSTSPDRGNPPPEESRSPPRKKQFSELDHPSQTSPPTHPCSSDSLSLATSDPSPCPEAMQSPWRGTSDLRPSSTSSMPSLETPSPSETQLPGTSGLSPSSTSSMPSLETVSTSETQLPGTSELRPLSSMPSLEAPSPSETLLPGTSDPRPSTSSIPSLETPSPSETLLPGTSKLGPSPTSSMPSLETPSPTGTQISSPLMHNISPTIPCVSPARPEGASLYRIRPMLRGRYRSPVSSTRSCFRRLPRSAWSTPTYCYSDMTYPQSSTSTTTTITTTNSSPSSPARFTALTRSSSHPLSVPARVESQTSNESVPSTSTSDPSLPTSSTASRSLSEAGSSGMSRWPGMTELAPGLAAAADPSASSGYETIETSEDVSDVDSPEPEIKNAGRTPGVRRHMLLPSLSQPEISDDDEPPSQPAKGHKGDDEPQDDIPSTSSGRRRVSYSPTTLADYAAIGQGPCPEAPSGYAPLALLAEPLNIDLEPLFGGPPRHRQDEEAAERFGGEAGPSGAAGESRAVAPFAVAPAAEVAAAAAAAEPILISADAPQIDEPAEGATESSSGGGSKICSRPGPSGDGVTASSGRRPSVVGSVVSLADLASAVLTISSTEDTPSPPTSGQPAGGEERAVSETPSDPPAFVMPGTPFLSLGVDLPLLEDALLETDSDMNRSEQKYLQQSCKSEGSGESKSSSRPLSSHSSLEQSEKLDISDDDCSPSETPHQLEDLERPLMESSSPGTGDQPALSDSTLGAKVPAAGETSSDLKIDESKGTGVDKLPKK